LSVQLDGLDRYRIENVLGGGGMAVVYRARDEELDRPVAIKVLADNLATDDSFRQRFLREAKLAARLAHPNVVQVYDSGEADDRPYIVMEYVEGETLAALLARRGRFPPAEAIELALQICSGLEHAHDKGLVHRDIKPQNLLIRSDGTLKIVDFGIARSAHGTQLTEAGSVLGTAAYLAPEQATGEEVTPAADVYGLGVVLYEMLAGRTPYTAESLTELHIRHQEQPIPALRQYAPEVPEALEDVIMRCLARLPAYRPQSAGELAGALAATSGDLPTVPLGRVSDAAELPTRVATPSGTRITPPYAPGWPSMLGRRRAAVAVGAAALVLAVVGLLAFGGDSASDSPPPAPRAGPTAAEQASDFAAWLRENSQP
jgi:eukaryotic-like serine/threonine-protein kinase